MPRPRKICTVEGCDRTASPSNAWCSYHRKHYAEINRRPELTRPADHELIDTGMVIDNRTGTLELVGGIRIPAPANLSLTYYFGDLTQTGRMPVLIPIAKARPWVDSLRRQLHGGAA